MPQPAAGARVAVIALSLATMALAGYWALAGSYDPLGIGDRLLSQALYGANALPADARGAFRFGLVLLGGATVGWCTAMIGLAWSGFPRRERWTYTTAWAALLAWFAADSAVCALNGWWFNVLLVNAPFLILFAIPLGILWPWFRDAPN